MVWLSQTIGLDLKISSPPPNRILTRLMVQEIRCKRTVFQNTHFSPCHSLGGLPGLNPKGADDLPKDSNMSPYVQGRNENLMIHPRSMFKTLLEHP